jgi:predicted enzyme related to lactoylglutathione lyase
VSVSVNASLDVPDLDVGVNFYVTVFGLVERARPFPTMAILEAGNLTVCIHEKPAGSLPAPGSTTLRDYARHWTPVHLDFHVALLDPVLERVLTLGGRVEAEYRSMGPKPTAFCSDPFGHGFCVIAASEK